MTHGSNTSNHHPLHPRDDREALSALFDGELPGDAARFALKRLDHDAGWRETCGRWQLIGDALRGEATFAAPPDFAAGVMRKLATEGLATDSTSPVAHVMDAAPARVAPRRRWLGGAALAASVAVAAVLVTRPFSQPPVQTQVAAEVVAPASAPERVVQSREAIAPAIAPVSASTIPPSSSSTKTLAAIDTSSAVRYGATRPARTSVRPSRQSEPANAVAATETTAAPKPFHPPADEIVTRPWPRAVLPEVGAETFTVGVGASSATASSYYPFEPRLPDAAASEPQR